MPDKISSMVLLAGGRSTRMGTDKADLMLNGKTFLQIQLEKAEQLGIRQIVISGYRGQCQNLTYPVIADTVPGKGPLGGLSTCLKKLPAGKCLVLSVDVILVPVSVLHDLLEDAEDSSAKAVILQHGQTQEPLIGVYDTSLADEMIREYTKYKGSVFGFLNRIGYETRQTDAKEVLFSNINTPDMYNRLIKTGNS